MTKRALAFWTAAAIVAIAVINYSRSLPEGVESWCRQQSNEYSRAAVRAPGPEQDAERRETYEKCVERYRNGECRDKQECRVFWPPDHPRE